jgi:hypothetical protein
LHERESVRKKAGHCGRHFNPEGKYLTGINVYFIFEVAEIRAEGRQEGTDITDLFRTVDEFLPMRCNCLLSSQNTKST